MSHTRILNEMEDGEVTPEVLRQVVNWKVTQEGSDWVVRSLNGIELARAKSEEGLVDQLDHYFFLEDNAFSSIEPDEVYAYQVIHGKQTVACESMSIDKIEQVYEKIVRGLPDFDETRFGEWYLSVAFTDDVKFVYIMYKPDDGEYKWYMAWIHNQFTEHVW